MEQSYHTHTHTHTNQSFQTCVHVSLPSSPSPTALLPCLAPAIVSIILSSWRLSFLTFLGFVLRCHLSEAFPVLPAYPPSVPTVAQTSTLISFSHSLPSRKLFTIQQSALDFTYSSVGEGVAVYPQDRKLVFCFPASTGSAPGTGQAFICRMSEESSQGHEMKKRMPSALTLRTVSRQGALSRRSHL